jgi:uncharacterized protein YuzE
MHHLRRYCGEDGHPHAAQGKATMIELRYDVEADALYIALNEAEWVDTQEVEDGTYVYIDTRGEPLGVEVHHPFRPWPLEEILARYRISGRTAQELRAYLPQPALLPTVAHPPASVPVTVTVV